MSHRPKLPEGASCEQLAERGPSLVLRSTHIAGSCNGCLQSGPAGKVWEMRLQGLLVRLCDDCFDNVIEQRKSYPR